jgi:hypothetical protein
MTINDKERVLIFRRIINENLQPSSGLSLLANQSDSMLLDILNSSVIPNSISENALKYNILFCSIYSTPKEKQSLYRTFTSILKLSSDMQKSEANLLKFGLFNGFKVFNWRYQLSRYIKISTDPSVGELQVNKRISSYIFEKIFPFASSIISKGEKNERFPRF